MLPAVALFVLIALILLQNNNIQLQPSNETTRPKATRLKRCSHSLLRKGSIGTIIFLILFYTGIIGLLSNLRPMMVDFGYDMGDIGFIVGICGTSMGILGSFLSGLGVKFFRS